MTRSRDVANIDTILTTKGDIYAASAAYTPARLAVGNNGETLVADSSTSTGLRWQTPKSQNVVYNSGFDIWQRGTANVTTAGAYTADRWAKGSGTHYGVSRQTTSDTTNLPFIQYAARVQRTNGSTTTTGMEFGQSFETADSIFYAGKTVTLSFYARRGANYSTNGNGLNVYVYTGTGTDQNIFGTYTGATAALNVSAVLTTTWQRFSGTATLSASATEMAIYALATPTGTAGANDWYEITGVQLEVGSVATPYTRQSATLAGEYAAALRYYWRVTPGSSSVFGSGFSYNTTSSLIAFPYPVPMRVRPTALEQSGTASDYKTLRTNGAAFDNCTVVPVFDGGTSSTVGLISITSANVVSGHAAMMFSNSAGAYLGWSAEL